MFGTWKYDPETDEVQNLRRAYDPVTARASSHIACDRCHEKKLKCSGEKDGCERCIANNLRCEYTRSSSRSSRRGKKSHKSTDSRSDSASGSSSRRAGSSSKKHHSSRHQGRTSGSATSNQEEPEGLLSQLDFSMLGPDDGFDLNLLSAGTDHAASSAGGGYGAPLATTAQDYASQTVTDAGYHQWGGQGYAGSAPGTSAAVYSQYATAPAYGYGGQQGFDGSEYDDQYGEYQNLDPRYWPQGSGHR